MPRFKALILWLCLLFPFISITLYGAFDITWWKPLQVDENDARLVFLIFSHLLSVGIGICGLFTFGED